MSFEGWRAAFGGGGLSVTKVPKRVYSHKVGLGRFWGNVDIFVGGREEVGAGAAGRCGVGVWRLVGRCVVALIG